MRIKLNADIIRGLCMRPFFDVNFDIVLVLKAWTTVILSIQLQNS